MDEGMMYGGMVGTKQPVKIGSDGVKEKLGGQKPNEGTDSCPGCKGQGHIREMEGKTGS